MKTEEEIINIVRNLPEWFTSEAVKQLKIDLERYSVLVEKDNFILGFIVYEIKNKKCLIKWAAVKKDIQRKGLGKKLIKKLVDFCRKNKINQIEVDTLAETEDYLPYISTRNFYHSIGFKDINIIKKGYPDGSDKLILRMDL